MIIKHKFKSTFKPGDIVYEVHGIEIIKHEINYMLYHLVYSIGENDYHFSNDYFVYFFKDGTVKPEYDGPPYQDKIKILFKSYEEAEKNIRDRLGITFRVEDIKGDFENEK